MKEDLYYEIFRKKDYANSRSYDEYKALEKIITVYEGTADNNLYSAPKTNKAYVRAICAWDN